MSSKLSGRKNLSCSRKTSISLSLKRVFPAFLFSLLAITFCIPTFFVRSANAETNKALDIKAEALKGDFYNAVNLDEFIPTLFNNTDSLIEGATFTVTVPTIPGTDSALINATPDTNVLEEQSVNEPSNANNVADSEITTTYKVKPTLKTQQNTGKVFTSLRGADGLTEDNISSLPETVYINYTTDGLSLSKGVLPKTSDIANFTAPILITAGAVLLVSLYIKNRRTSLKGAAHAKGSSTPFFSTFVALTLLSAGTLCAIPALAHAENAVNDAETVTLTVNKEIDTVTFTPGEGEWTNDPKAGNRPVRVVYNGVVAEAPGTPVITGKDIKGWKIDNTENAFEIGVTRVTANITVIPRLADTPVVKTSVTFKAYMPEDAPTGSTFSFTLKDQTPESVISAAPVNIGDPFDKPEDVTEDFATLDAAAPTGFFLDGFFYTQEVGSKSTEHYLSCNPSYQLSTSPSELTCSTIFWPEGATIIIHPQFVANKDSSIDADADFWMASGKEIWTPDATTPFDPVKYPGVALGEYKSNGSYVSPTTGVVRTMAEIKADKEVLHSDGTSAEKTMLQERYTSYMMTDRYHLYSKYDASAAYTADNQYLEARIINVGEHTGYSYSGAQWDGTDDTGVAYVDSNFKEEGDESALTFQSCYVLPTAYRINAYDQNNPQRIFVGNAGSLPSELYTSLNTAAAQGDPKNIYDYYPSSLKSSIAEVNKTCVGTPVKDDPLGLSYVSYKSQKLWLLATCEIAGKDEYFSFTNKEGAQYQFYAGRATIDGVGEEPPTGFSDYSNPILFQRGKDRNGDTPAGSSGVWWQRSADPYSGGAGFFGFVFSVGAVGGGRCSGTRGVAPCFCL